jgi:ubiquinone/menaquinone biosynthesis C-methylase UbiE
MSSNFKDHFSSVAKGYAENRPTYPPELFDWLANQCSEHMRAWDCGAGSGQASIGLAQYFRRVIATDASAAQIAEATAHNRIEYRVAPAEESDLPAASIDLITVAQAMHWFNLPQFYDEVRRVLKPNGLIASWCYGVMKIEGEEADAIVQHFYRNEVGPYWPPERRHVENGYRNISFPFQRITTPPFTMSVRWGLDQLTGYFRSWTATTRFIKEKGVDPVNQLELQLLKTWDDPKQKRIVEWPLSVLVGRL